MRRPSEDKDLVQEEVGMSAGEEALVEETAPHSRSWREADRETWSSCGHHTVGQRSPGWTRAQKRVVRVLNR